MPSPQLSIRHALALGALQGPTELLPISSSAHTALLPWLAGWPYSELDPELRKSFEVALHIGAGAALAIEMRAELLQAALALDRRQASAIALSLAPPALAGLTLQRAIERRLGGPRSIAASLLAGALAMALVERAGAPGEPPSGRSRSHLALGDGLALGLAQALALIPGVSRNGATLVAARARGFDRADAEALSWHAGLPVILGAGALKARELARTTPAPGVRRALLAGGGAAFFSTLLSARISRRSRREGRSLLGSSLYRGVLSALVIARLRARANAHAEHINLHE